MIISRTPFRISFFGGGTDFPQWYEKNNGHVIKIFTSRYMGRNNENSKLVNKKYYNSVKKYLENWGVKYDKLILGKPSYDYFVDDKTINPKNNNLKKFFKKYLIK